MDTVRASRRSRSPVLSGLSVLSVLSGLSGLSGWLLVPALLASAGLLAGCSGGSAAVGPATQRARIVHTLELGDRTVDLMVRSPAVGADVPVRLLLPRGPAPSAAAQSSTGSGTAAGWPVLLLLHGCCNEYGSWTRETDVEQLTADSGVLVVMPDGGPAGFYSDWLDGPGWETFHTVELPMVLAAAYHASDRWVVAGLSMGGLGALDYAARHPALFRAVAAFSPIADTLHDPSGYQELVRSQGEDPDRLWGDPAADVEVWRAHNPTDLAARLRGRPVYLSIGDGDPGPLDAPTAGVDRVEQSLFAESLTLRDALEDAGVDATFDSYGAGRHAWPYWERSLHRAWPMLTAALRG
jgi:S-formylglutathione hydrolase FrmB